MAVVCSSWVPTNCGTSKRSIAYAEGNSGLDYVAAANCMTSRSLSESQYSLFCVQERSFGTIRANLRCILLAMLVVSVQGTFLIEQPGSSLMRYYFRMEELIRRLPVNQLKLYTRNFEGYLYIACCLGVQNHVSSRVCPYISNFQGVRLPRCTELVGGWPTTMPDRQSVIRGSATTSGWNASTRADCCAKIASRMQVFSPPKRGLTALGSGDGKAPSS